jgi:hypothetical protein
MSSLVNIAAILVFAFLVFGGVMVALRFLIPAEPYRPERPNRSRTRRRMLVDLVGVLAVIALMQLAVEVRLAYGAPFGERAYPVVEVVGVGDCERGPLGFGVVRSCEVTEYQYTAWEQGPAPWSEAIEVATGEAVEPGDRIAHYSSSGWTDFALLGSGGSRWQPVSAEDRPNLVWLPTATLIAATALSAALLKRYPRRVSGGTTVGS